MITIKSLDKDYEHRLVNHSLNFVARDGTNTNSIESAWKSAKTQFKRIQGVSRLNLQSYLDEHCWRLNNGNTNGWKIFKATLAAIKDFYDIHNTIDYDNEIIVHDDLISNDIPDDIIFLDSNEDEQTNLSLDLPLGDYLEFLPKTHSSVISASSFYNFEAIPIAVRPSTSKRHMLNRTFTEDEDHYPNLPDIDLPPFELTDEIVSKAESHNTSQSTENESLSGFNKIISDFKKSKDNFYKFPSSLTQEQRLEIQQIANMNEIKHQIKGGKYKCLYLFKDNLILPVITSRQKRSEDLIGFSTQHHPRNENFQKVEKNAIQPIVGKAAKRDRPSKGDTEPKQIINSSSKYNLRKRTKKF